MRVFLMSIAWMALGWLAVELVAGALPPSEAARDRLPSPTVPRTVPPARDGTMWTAAFPAAPAAGKAEANRTR
jgi:hypothetical protein